MSVAFIHVPSRADMARGIGQAILNGVEFEVSENNHVEITCADEVRLDRIIKAFNGSVLGKQNVMEITPDLPRRENIRI